MPLVELRTDALVLNAEAEEVFTIIHAAAAVYCHSADHETSVVILSNCKAHHRNQDDTKTPSVSAQLQPGDPNAQGLALMQRSASTSGLHATAYRTCSILVELRIWKNEQDQESDDRHKLQELLLYLTEKTRLMALLSSRPGNDARSPLCRIHTHESPRGYLYDFSFFDGPSLIEPDQCFTQSRLLEYCNTDTLGAITPPGTISLRSIKSPNHEGNTCSHGKGVVTRAKSTEHQTKHSDRIVAEQQSYLPRLGSWARTQNSPFTGSMKHCHFPEDPMGVKRGSPVNTSELLDRMSSPGSLCGSVFDMMEYQSEDVEDPKDQFRRLMKTQESLHELTPDDLLAQVAATKVVSRSRAATLVDHAECASSQSIQMTMNAPVPS